MTRDEAKELLPIIIAFAEGKTIQAPSRVGTWCDCDEVDVYSAKKYRIKPEPREFWLVPNLSKVGYMIYSVKPITEPGMEILHVREVL